MSIGGSVRRSVIAGVAFREARRRQSTATVRVLARARRTATSVVCVFRGSADLPGLLRGQVSDEGDLIKFVVVGFIHQENPIGEDCQRGEKTEPRHQHCHNPE